MVGSMHPSPPTTQASPPSSSEPHDEHSCRSSSFTAAHLASPPSLASFSFSQFFSCHDESYEVETTTATAFSANEHGIDMSSTLPSSSAVFSFEDCVRFKLCLTCALCGRLLRHQPAAIETCGHCFCYECINTAVEDGCVPVVKEWPWSRLAEEVEAGAARWAASTSTAPQATDTGRTAHDSASPRPPAKTEDAEKCVVVRAVTPSRVRPSTCLAATNGATAQPDPFRKPRKIRQKCPLCMGPAFKWLLVSVPPVAELCTQLSLAYPALEETLNQLTSNAARSPAESSSERKGVPLPHSPQTKETPTQGGNSDAAEEQHQQQKIQLSSDGATDALFAVTAFTPSSVPPTPRHSGASFRGGESRSNSKRSSHSTSDEEDEEVVRRRRRSSGGPRKGITFADEVLAVAQKPHCKPVTERSAPHFATLPVLTSEEHSKPAAVSALSTLSNVADALLSIGEKGKEPLDAPTLRGSSRSASSGGSNFSVVTTAAISTSPQLSVDLIPSPSTSTTAPVATTPHPTWSDEVAHSDSGGRVRGTPRLSSQQARQQQQPPLQPTGILGQSPSADHFAEAEEEEERTENSSRGLPLIRSGTVVNADFTAALRASQVPYLSKTIEEDAGKADSALRSPSASDLLERDFLEKGFAETPVTERETSCVLLDTSSLSVESLTRFSAHPVKKHGGASGQPPCCPACDDCTFVCDEADTHGAQSAFSPYSCVRATLTRCPAHLFHRRVDKSRCKQQAATEQQDGGTSWSEGMAAAAAASVHPCDVWELNAAHLHRHPHVPSCYVVLRSGRLTWHDSRGDDNSKAVAAAVAVRCVAGSYPPRSSAKKTEPCRRTVSLLSPAVCTAAVLGVPCVDIDWFLTPPPARSSWEVYVAALGAATAAATDGGETCSTEASTPVPTFLEASCLSSMRYPLQPWRIPWMMSTRQTIRSSEMLALSSPPSSSSNSVPTQQQPGMSFFFVLPDGAVSQLADAFYDSWKASRHDHHHHRSHHSEKQDQWEEEETNKCLRTPQKRQRDGDAQGEAWDATDGHPQRAWRRLLLASGCAVVEISALLFALLAAAATDMETSASDVKDETAEEAAATALTRHARLLPRDAPTSSWIHVDIDEGCHEGCHNGEHANASAAASCTRNKSADHTPSETQLTLFLLYSTMAARRACEHLSLGAAVTPCHSCETTTSGAASAESAFHLAFHQLLRRIADLLVFMLSPILLEVLQFTLPIVSEVRPASWLLESIVDDCRCTGSRMRRVSSKQRKKEAQTNAGDSRDNRTDKKTHRERPQGASSHQQQHKQNLNAADELHALGSDAERANSATPLSFLGASPSPFSDASQNPPQRFGVYRSLLYSDTP